MVALMGFSAFCSASEAALFYLSPADRREMKTGSRAERVAVELLANSDRLLAAVLFANLLANVAYFALASICSIHLERNPESGPTWAIGFGLGALLSLIVFSEMLAKSAAVIAPRWMARQFAIPLRVLVALVAPLMPPLRSINQFALRILWPNFKPEPMVEIEDLEQVIEVSRGNETLIRQEQAVLNNLIQISEIRVEEWMRPRTQVPVLRPPVRLAELSDSEQSDGYLFFTEADSDEIEKAIRLDDLTSLPEKNVEKLAIPVVYLPWTASVADAFEKMLRRDRNVTAVVNEFGETIGVLTIDDIWETLFTYSPSRVERLLDRQPLVEIETGKWLVQGLTNLRILARRLNLELPPTSSVTVAGLIQEQVQRLAEVGDECVWGPCYFRVVETAKRGSLVAELQLVTPAEEGS
jgi:CBS domain containing-hemolysin-like protein